MADVALERGLRGANATLVAERAGVSRTTFTDQFPTLEECFLGLIDWMLQQATPLVIDAFEREPSWSDGVLTSLERLLTFFDTRPARAQVCLLESMALRPSALQPRAQFLGRLGLFVDQRVRKELSLERQPPTVMSEVAIGLVLGFVRRRLLIGEAPPFIALLAPLAEVIVALYLGPSAGVRAAGEGRKRALALLEENAGAPGRRQVGEVPKLLRRANSHRMRMCVRYLSQRPGSSNTEIGTGIGISHPGQVSVLLGRLHEAELLEKEAGGAGRPNAWRLSPFGAEVACALERWSGPPSRDTGRRPSPV